ncbi:hypothetical protein BT67DRAFT_379033 [Trichocladium antarcticum]|uniref:N-acetyltransferase domain-containing protein n=1 Tax=Trichocladium antarcticum TaxID=1450529 RepID=A0AAN6ZEH7_9PEZI|nr:hypothetical protein BT67DRAFT_379033 [Trichocladium antarcticum]
MTPPDEVRAWTRQVGDVTYTCSTDPSLVHVETLNAVLDSDLIYWTTPVPLETLQRVVEQSLCFGVYAQGGGDEQDGAPPSLYGPMVGFGRLVTDYATFGYLTDVYVLPAHQGRGLARWMMGCLDEVLASWPYLRRCLLLTATAGAARLYRETIGAVEVSETSTGKLFVMERPGRTVTRSGVGEVQGQCGAGQGGGHAGEGP